MMDEEEYHGSMTMTDGRRVYLTSDEAKSLWDDIDRGIADRAERMPDSKSALSIINSAISRLKELGWNDAIYCPKDGTEFAVCEFGSIGMWKAFYTGKWPDGYIHYADCVSRPKGMYFKEMSALTEWEIAHVSECDKSVGEWIDRLGRSFGDAQ